jgi:hypothetical protein
MNNTASKIPTTAAACDGVVNTIIAQLGGVGRLQAMLGAEVLADPNHLALHVRIKARGSKASLVRITLSLSTDTYTIDTFTGRGAKIRASTSVRGIQEANLRRTCEELTGLAWSL